jgi:hypothetical protein
MQWYVSLSAETRAWHAPHGPQESSVYVQIVLVIYPKGT